MDKICKLHQGKIDKNILFVKGYCEQPFALVNDRFFRRLYSFGAIFSNTEEIETVYMQTKEVYLSD